ncbi:MAG: hypothetical protein ABIN80_28855 [Dyadobacter sp.]|uniref:hypothetical protein n=1 Tax=Dyadobacter sp. TaxID=1914288 RepID=UPI003263DE90
MIRFDFDWSGPLNQVILALLVMLLAWQIWLVFQAGKKDANVSPARFGVRMALNVLLWGSMLAFILQPFILKNPSSTFGILVGEEVPATIAKNVADSAGKAALVKVEELKENSFDTLLVLGQGFKLTDFESIARNAQPAVIKWIPYFQSDQIQSINWKGIVRKGEMQVVQGSMESSEMQLLKLRFGDRTLDSVSLDKGFHAFKLTFPAFGEGRNVTELVLGNTMIDTIKFFTRPAEKLTVRFMLENPDFESRNLATWLGKNGHAVMYDAILSKNMNSKLNINKAENPDIIVTDATNASSGIVKKAVSEGKSVLFMNLTEPAAQINRINVALGTRFQVKKISNEATISLGTELTALPFTFTPNHYSLQISKLPVAIEKTTGKIAVSLLNETFPLQLAGDSTRYQHIWNTILAFTRPAEKDRINIEAPVLLGIPTLLKIDGLAEHPKMVKIGNDTTFLGYSALNSQSATGRLTPTESGWIELRDYPGIEIHVQKTSPSLSIATMHHFVQSNERYHSKLAETTARNTESIYGISQKLPDWFWFGLILICFAAVWIEGKIL